MKTITVEVPDYYFIDDGAVYALTSATVPKIESAATLSLHVKPKPKIIGIEWGNQLGTRQYGEYKSKGVWLNPRYRWEIVTDDEGCACLVAWEK
jgi:hypothetical protein